MLFIKSSRRETCIFRAVVNPCIFGWLNKEFPWNCSMFRTSGCSSSYRHFHVF